MNNLIQQLKDNKKPFGLMSEEMQAKAIELKLSQFQYYGYIYKWYDMNESWDGKPFEALKVYRLRDTYADEPEIVECEIQEDGLGKFHYNRPDGITNCSLSTAVNYSDFIGIKFADGSWHDKPIKPVNAAGEIVFDPIFVADIISGAVRILNATHVLFRRKKEE